MVYTNKPLRQIFHKLDELGRTLRWSIELCRYDIHSISRKTIKAQALTNFFVETSFSFEDEIQEEKFREPEELDEVWLMMVDGAVNSNSVGVITVLTSPKRQYTKQRSIRLQFPISNNQANYEALINELL